MRFKYDKKFLVSKQFYKIQMIFSNKIKPLTDQYEFQ